MHVKVKELPEALRAALASVGYHGADISVRAKDSYSMSAGGSGKGRRAFVCAVDLATGRCELAQGSWGGPNPFNPQNAVDLADESHPLPPNFAVIHGSEGDGVYATVDVHPDTLRPLLPPTVELTEGEHAILCAMAGLTSAGRKKQIDDWCSHAYRAANPKYDNRAAGVKAEADCRATVEAVIARLVERKLLSRNKAGAVSVTTEGRNAAGERPSQNRALFSMDWFPTI